jgi:ribosomal protein L32
MPAPKTSKAELTIRQLRVNLQEIGARECPCGHWNLPQYVCNSCGYDRTDPDSTPPKKAKP